jgi:hypothetical protein
MKNENAIPLLQAIIARERKDGCPMAHESLIKPVLRRWASYERRFKRHKDKSLKHRAYDLAKGIMESCTDEGHHYYDPACCHHLAESFAIVLSGESEVANSTHTGNR